MAKKSTAIVPTMLRMREDLRQRLEREAKKKDHSLNAEMVRRLEQSFADDEQNEREVAIINLMINSDDISVDLMRKIVFQLWKRRGAIDREFNIKQEEMDFNRLLSAREKNPNDTSIQTSREHPTKPRKTNK